MHHFVLTHAIFTPVKSCFRRFFGHDFFHSQQPPKNSIKMFQSHQTLCSEYRRNFQGLPTHGLAYAKVKNPFSILKILKVIGDIGITLNDFTQPIRLE